MYSSRLQSRSFLLVQQPSRSVQTLPVSDKGPGKAPTNLHSPKPTTAPMMATRPG
jgi:hypothetical protein